jgi:hypothetical protein
MSLLHWLWSLPTCEDADVVGYLRMYLGSLPGLSVFAHSFAARKYEWRDAKRRLAQGKEALFTAEREAIANGERDVGDVGDARFERVFTERTLGLALNDYRGQIIVKGCMPNSAAAKRGVPTGVVLESVNGDAAAHRPLKEVQRLISRAERPVRLSFARAPQSREERQTYPEGRSPSPQPGEAAAQGVDANATPAAPAEVE